MALQGARVAYPRARRYVNIYAKSRRGARAKLFDMFDLLPNEHAQFLFVSSLKINVIPEAHRRLYWIVGSFRGFHAD